MTARILSFPFRLTPAGVAATVTEGSEEAHAEAIAVLIGTRRGERQLVPAFGIPDPVFADLRPADIEAGVELFGPEGLRITDVMVDWRDATTADVTVEFTDREGR